jgi:hypothetical protein
MTLNEIRAYFESDECKQEMIKDLTIAYIFSNILAFDPASDPKYKSLREFFKSKLDDLKAKK